MRGGYLYSPFGLSLLAGFNCTEPYSSDESYLVTLSYVKLENQTTLHYLPGFDSLPMVRHGKCLP